MLCFLAIVFIMGTVLCCYYVQEVVARCSVCPSNLYSCSYCLYTTTFYYSWFHPHLSRHAADCILIDNAPEGSYLLRPSNDGQYALSVKYVTVVNWTMQLLCCQVSIVVLISLCV